MAEPSSNNDRPQSQRLDDVSRPAEENDSPPATPVCQLCGGRLIEIRAKLQCERCHTIWETCCEGGPQ